jgi:hypothetical protein
MRFVAHSAIKSTRVVDLHRMATKTDHRGQLTAHMGVNRPRTANEAETSPDPARRREASIPSSA